MIDDVSQMSDDQIARLLDRYRSHLAALDWEPQVETLNNYRAFLVNKIRRLEGERERREESEE
jgi:hypothetical protein